MPGSGPPCNQHLGLPRTAHSAQTHKDEAAAAATAMWTLAARQAKSRGSGYQDGDTRKAALAGTDHEHESGSPRAKGGHASEPDEMIGSIRALVGGRARTGKAAPHHQNAASTNPDMTWKRIGSNRGRVEVRQGNVPEQRECDGGDASQRHQPDRADRRPPRGNHGEVDIEGPEIRLLGRTKKRGVRMRDGAEACHAGTSQQGGGRAVPQRTSRADEAGRPAVRKMRKS